MHAISQPAGLAAVGGFRLTDGGFAIPAERGDGGLEIVAEAGVGAEGLGREVAVALVIGFGVIVAVPVEIEAVIGAERLVGGSS